jgi:hypothetical protein
LVEHFVLFVVAHDCRENLRVEEVPRLLRRDEGSDPLTGGKESLFLERLHGLASDRAAHAIRLAQRRLGRHEVGRAKVA